MIYSVSLPSSYTHGSIVYRLFVCDTDPRDKPGEHWIAMCIDGEQGEYFDLIGRAPTHHAGLNDVLVHGFICR